LFGKKDHKMNKANKAGFSNISLKGLTDPLHLTDQFWSSLVVDGGWLLYMVKWSDLARDLMLTSAIFSILEDIL